MQVQCQNCGGFKITERPKLLVIETGNYIEKPSGCGVWFVILLTFGMVVRGIVSVASNEATFGVIFIVMGVTLFTVFVRWIAKDRKRFLPAKGYRCIICGYEWNWHEDANSSGPVSNNPQLIHMGNKVLEEEEERRRLASANAHLNKKK